MPCPRSSAPQPHTNHQRLEEAVRALRQQLQPTARHDTDPRSTLPILGVVGLAAVAGAVVYAARTPRIPPGVVPVENFDIGRYMGKWYEVARIDHRFERGLQRTQAEYTRNRNGTVHVINRGFDPKRNFWKIAHGTAKATLTPDIGALKVSFFGPFYAGYNIVALCPHYQWALVIGGDVRHCWILSRTPALPEGVSEMLLERAATMGVDTQSLLWVHQDGVNTTGSYQ